MKQQNFISKYKTLLLIIGIAIATILAVTLFNIGKSKPTIEIYAFKDLLIKESDYLQKIENSTPVLVTKDITAYNKETKTIFLRDEIVDKYKKIRQNNINKKINIGNGSSIILSGGADSKERMQSYAIVFDNKITVTGLLEKPINTSSVFDKIYMKDCSQGLQLYIPKKPLSKNAEKDLTKLEENFSKSKLLTNKPANTYSYFANKDYDTEKLWQAKTKHIGDNSKIGQIINYIAFPDYLKYKSFELITEKEPYGMIINFETLTDNNKSDMVVNDIKNVLYIKSKIISLLVDNADFIKYNIKNGDELITIDQSTSEFRAEDYQAPSSYGEFHSKLIDLESLEKLRYYNEISQTPISKKVHKLVNEIAQKSPNDKHKQVEDFIKAHPKQYQELLSLGIDGYNVMKTVMLKSSNYRNITWLRDEIMTKACGELLADPKFLKDNFNFYIINNQIYFKTDSTARELTAKEVEEVNIAFQQINSHNDTINPVCHLLNSFYEKAQDMNIAETVYYMPTEEMSDDNPQDVKAFNKLKNLDTFPFIHDKKISECITPLKKISRQEVEDIIKGFTGLTLDKFNNNALYLDEYKSFYGYSSDAGVGHFNCESGSIDGDQLTLNGKESTLKLQRQGDHFVIQAHIKNN